MKIKFSLEASSLLQSLENYVEGLNTKGSGKRYLKRFKNSIKKYAQSNVVYKLCSNQSLATLSFSCISINNWIVVFKIEDNTFLVYDIVWGPLLA